MAITTISSKPRPATTTTKGGGAAAAAAAAAAAGGGGSSSYSSAGSGGAPPSPDVPIFLQKAYLMIDTCDPKICCWSDDGATFIVKNTSLFETTVIPQFFKHNKFSSFVRQLNFYGFRKVKFSNSLRIDHKLEAETAKYWRFRHDKFRRGRRDLLIEIKRTPNSSSSSAPKVAALSSSSAAAGVPGAVARPSMAPSNGTVAMNPGARQNPVGSVVLDKEATHLKTEMQELKQRIASMTKNIDELTDLVKKVSVKDEPSSSSSLVVSPGSVVEGGGKRKKMDCDGAVAIKQEDAMTVTEDHILPDWNPSSSDLAGVDSLLLGDAGGSLLPPLPDFHASSSDMDSPLSSPSRMIPSSVPSDDTFVEELFQAFNGEDDIILQGLEGLVEDESSDGNGTVGMMNDDEESSNNVGERDDGNDNNRPCPYLMKRIEDSLSTIPRDMHEMVANRLIDAISDSGPIAESYRTVDDRVVKADRSISMDEDVAATDAMPGPRAVSDEAGPGEEEGPSAATVAAAPAMTTIPLPLAVATLKTILAEYGVSVECSKSSDSSATHALSSSRSPSPSCKDAATDRTRFTKLKLLPVVPMHA